MNYPTKCDRCGFAGPFRVCGDGKTEGRLYGINGADAVHCDVCCGEMDLADMLARGKACLYLTGEGRGAKITNWPGTLSLPVFGSTWTGRHNMAGVQTFASFRVPGDPFVWTGRCIGRNTQVFHARRTKVQA